MREERNNGEVNKISSSHGREMWKFGQMEM
jgi:hypothetical protein